MTDQTAKKYAFSLPQKTYPAKLLLTGEYSVLKGSSAVLIPLPIYGARWKKMDSLRSDWRDLLSGFISYLRKNTSESPFLKMKSMEAVFEAGYFLDSNVPQGCGLGSSGVFCAAIYDAFGIKNQDEGPIQVRERLRLMENFFHGKSSGLDPLVSYYNKAVHLKSEEINFFQTKQKATHNNLPNVWLFDSEKKRSTATLVNSFHKFLDDPDNSKSFFNEYIPIIEKSTLHYLKGEWQEWYSCIQEISLCQTKIFKPMIPDGIFDLWMDGLETGSYYMKLCGAGGGGFFYLFSDKENINIQEFKVIPIRQYLSTLITD